MKRWRMKCRKKAKWKFVLSGDLLVALGGSPFLPLPLPSLYSSLNFLLFSSGQFDKLPVLMPSVQCPLSTPINSYIYQSFL